MPPTSEQVVMIENAQALLAENLYGDMEICIVHGQPQERLFRLPDGSYIHATYERLVTAGSSFRESRPRPLRDEPQG